MKCIYACICYMPYHNVLVMAVICAYYYIMN